MVPTAYVVHFEQRVWKDLATEEMNRHLRSRSGKLRSQVRGTIYSKPKRAYRPSVALKPSRSAGSCIPKPEQF